MNNYRFFQLNYEVVADLLLTVTCLSQTEMDLDTHNITDKYSTSEVNIFFNVNQSKNADIITTLSTSGMGHSNNKWHFSSRGLERWTLFCFLKQCVYAFGRKNSYLATRYGFKRHIFQNCFTVQSLKALKLSCFLNKMVHRGGGHKIAQKVSSFSWMALYLF